MRRWFHKHAVSHTYILLQSVAVLCTFSMAFVAGTEASWCTHLESAHMGMCPLKSAGTLATQFIGCLALHELVVEVMVTL